jgi:hypothetical protein
VSSRSPSALAFVQDPGRAGGLSRRKILLDENSPQQNERYCSNESGQAQVLCKRSPGPGEVSGVE